MNLDQPTNMEQFNITNTGSDGQIRETWETDEFGHMTRIYSAPEKMEDRNMNEQSQATSEPQRAYINIGDDFDSSEFQGSIKSDGKTYTRDENARLIGGQWISGADRKRLIPVPAKVNLSLRDWNSLSGRTREQISSMMTEMDKETLDEIANRSSDEWKMIVSGVADPQKQFAKYLTTNRPSKDFDPNDPISYVEELDNLGFTEGSQATEDEEEMPKVMASRLEAWRTSRNRQIENPSYGLLSAPRLSEEAMMEWVDAASIGAAVSLRQSLEVLELSAGDKLPDNLFDRIARRFITEQEPPFSSFDDFEMAVDLVKYRFGYPSSLDIMIEDGTIPESAQDMILSGKFIELLSSSDMATVEPKTRSQVQNLMSLVGVYPMVPEEIPNDKMSGNFRPYIVSQTA